MTSSWPATKIRPEIQISDLILVMKLSAYAILVHLTLNIFGYPSNNSRIWLPTTGQTYQIILSGILNTSTDITPDVDIFDIDLFYHPRETIQAIQRHGKKVICYFSAGTSEDWRQDWTEFKEEDKNACLPDWSGERWLNIKSADVWEVMRKRILLASQKGCDAIDPDNMDGFSNDNGFGLTTEDYIKYMQRISSEAARYGMSTGLKNAEAILPDVGSIVQFAVNEQCSENEGSCTQYKGFNKPVYHIEYVSSHSVQPSEVNRLCLKNSRMGSQLTTVLKTMNLDGWVQYCDGKSATSVTVSDHVTKGLKECYTNSP